MQEKKQSSRNNADTANQSVYWGTIAQAILLFIPNIHGIAVLFAGSLSTIAMVGRVLFLLNILAGITSIVFTLRRRQDLGFVISYFAALALATETVLILEGFAVVETVVLLITALIGMAWLCPPRWRRGSAIATALVLAFLWIIEMGEPSWRLTSAATPMGLGIGILFSVAFAVVMFFQVTKNSIRLRLIYGFLIVTIIPLSLIGFLNYNSTRSALTKDANQALLSAASQTAAQIDSFIENRLNIARSEAQFAIVADYILLPASERPGSLEEARLNNFIFARLSEDPVYISSVAVYDINGNTLADTFTSDIGTNKLDRTWFQAAVATGLPHASNLQFSQTTSAPSLYFSAPVRDGAGRIIGIIRTRYNAAILQDILTAEVKRAGQSSFPVLIDAETHVRLAHGMTPSLVFKTIVPQDAAIVQSLQAKNLMPPGTPEELSTNLPSFESALLAYETQPFFATQLASADTVSNDRGAVVKTRNQDWLVVYAVSEAEFSAPINAQALSSLILTLVTGIIVVVFAVFVARSLSGPIARLTKTAETIATGDINVQAQVETSDEIGTLAGTFNRMTQQLRDLIASLESRVAERTRNLELAAEVGRTVSQVRELDVMLTDAAELIRKQFDLYYVQVYLVNASKTSLNLQAGTGQVGRELLGRNHRLPLNADSINGRAVIEKRSVVISDTAASATFKPNPLLPDTRSEMAVPLVVGDRVVGVLDMQSEKPNSLNQDVLAAFEALAGQIAIAIQNANFLAEVEQARAEVETQAKRLTRANWAEYLDAIHEPEQAGFVFEQNKVLPLTEEAEIQENALVAPITVTGEPLGDLMVEIEGQSPISRTDELVATVARQVSQQIENLRLLASAERYRLEAEEASQRLTREGWKNYIQTSSYQNLSYFYNLNEVLPYQGNGHLQGEAVDLPLKVREEPIGKIVVHGIKPEDNEALSLVNAVAERLSTHIDSLRQYEQAQSALTQSERLFNASHQLTQATDLQELVASAVKSLDIPVVNRALLTSFDYDAADEINKLTVIANWWSGEGTPITPVGTQYPQEVVRVMPMFVSSVPVFFNDAFSDERVDATTMQLVKRLNLRAVAVLPLHLGSRQIGALILEAEKPHNFTIDETRLFTSLAPQISTILENRQQYEKAQHQAEREAMLNLINQKIQSATTVESVLQITARELGHALGAPLTIAQLGLKDGQTGNGENHN